VDNFAALAGRGVRGEIDGELYHLGNHRLVEELGLCSPALEEKFFALEEQGKTVILLCDTSGPLALFAVADTVKHSSREAIQQLHELGIKTLMLTGDNTAHRQRHCRPGRYRRSAGQLAARRQAQGD
jgi:Zn2+/Cd2+-exporting ATPase